MIKELDNELNLINELESSFNYVLKDINKDLSNNPFSHYLLYLDNNKIVGYINYYLMYEKLEIANFNVLEDYQNNHIGTKLLEYLIKEYENKVSNITLEVKDNNKKAIYLYEKMGFKHASIRKGYYNGIDGILMERKMEMKDIYVLGNRHVEYNIK